ncbi:MAG: type II toxin-antitoxin system HicB family antitoxin [Chloroflexota bacterium]
MPPAQAPRDIPTTIEPELLERVHAIMAQPYRLILRQLPAEDGGGYFIEVPDLPGCWADGATLAEAHAHLQESMEAWLASALERGDAIPVPEHVEDLPSGKFVVRVPRSLHRRLRQRAQAEDISLNQLVLSYIAAGMSYDGPVSPDQ